MDGVSALLSVRLRFWYIKIPATILIVLGTALLVRSALDQSWAFLLEKCPNTDVLLWDANLRLLTVLDQYQDLRDGDVVRALYPVFDAPTWPTLRNFLSLTLFFVNPGGPSTIVDISISFVFYILIFPSILLIAFEITRDWLRAALIFFFASMMIIHAREFPVYSLSAMLETQGMFFMLWTTYFLFKIYENFAFREASLIVRERKFVPRRKRFFWGLLIFSQGLFHTKYPYGIMLILAIFAVDILRGPGRYIDLLALMFDQHFFGKRRSRWQTFFFVLRILVLVNFVGAVVANAFGVPLTKYVKDAFFFVLVVFFIDVNVYFFRNRFALARLMGAATAQVYVAVVLPTAAWMLLHPDRVSSIIGTQQHSQEAGRSYTQSLATNVFDDPLPFLVMSALAGIALLIFLIARARRGVERGERLDTLLANFGRPLTAATFVLLFQFLIMELLTDNKQLRHIYHLVPALLVVAGAWVMRFPYLLGLSGPRFVNVRRGIVLLTLALPLIAVRPVLAPGGLLAGQILPAEPDVAYVQARHMCFTGTEREVYEPVRWFALRLDPAKRYILLNSFHHIYEPVPGRFLATDFDLLLRMRTLQQGAVRNDSQYRRDNWEEFDAALLLTQSCDDAFAQAAADELQQRAAKLGHQVTLTSAYAHPTAPLCLREYRLESMRSEP